MSPGSRTGPSDKRGESCGTREQVLSVAGVVFGGALLLGACSQLVACRLGRNLRNDSDLGDDCSNHAASHQQPRARALRRDSKKTGSKAPASAVSQQTFNGIDSQLGALVQSLSQAIGSVDNPQGDS